MARAKMIYVSAKTHDRLKVLATRRRRSMGEVVSELVDAEIAELANPWTSIEGLLLQQRALSAVWEDPDLDTYNDA